MSDPQQPEHALSRCAVQQERDGRHAIFHSSECDGTRCGIDLIELPSDHDPRAYDHLKGAGTLHLGPGIDSLPPAAQTELRAAAAGFTAEGTVKPCKMEPCEPGGAHVMITPWSPEEVAELQAAIDAADDPDTCPACTDRSRETTHMICMECGTDYTAEPPRRITPHTLEVLREALAEVDRLRKRHASPVPDWFYGGSRVPTDMSTDSYSHAIASAAAGLLVHIDATPYAYPEAEQDPADFARDQLAHVAAAALWTLVAHAASTGGDDHHLETFTEALINTDRLPPAVVEPLAPAFAQLLGYALPAIIASINPPDGPEATS